MFQKLFEPIMIGGVTLKNRMSTAAMEVLYCDENGMVTDRYLNYVEARAKGGFGLIINEAHAVMKGTGGFRKCSGMWMDEQIPGQIKVAEAAHRHGAKIAIQLIHIGRQGEEHVTNRRLVAPSAIQDPTLYETPEELNREDIQEIVNAFGDAAARVRKAGYDLVEVHGAHGYLIQQFLSPYSNKRTDEYGGNLYNRARFSLEIIKNIQEKAGKDFPVIFRISMDEFMEDGLSIAETRAYAKMLEGAGVSAIHASQGNYATIRYMLPPAAVPHAFTADLAEEIKRVVSIPVINVGRYTDPFVAEAVLDAGKADIIAFARQSLADPQFPNKTKEGKIDDIQYCVGCLQGCVGGKKHGIYAQVPVACLANPVLGHESEYDFSPVKEAKKVVVVGGGVAGMEAAYAAAKRGNKVTLYEKNNQLGGQWNYASMPPHKQELTTITIWLKRQLGLLGVDVKLNSEFKPELFNGADVDAVIVATGAKPVAPRIKGIESSNVCYIPDVLGCTRTMGNKPVVIGGGQVGTETAAFLANINKDVTLIELTDKLCVDGQTAVNSFLFDYLDNKKVNILTNASVTEITDESVTYRKDEKEYVITGVTDVVVAVGSKSFDEVSTKITDVGKVVVVGDATKAGDGLAAIADGFKAGYYI
ncbi:MAG: oxidase [Herbinix sp.]|jgi:2,4-dienoyl-CoA reductase-like NADH-dependent reductase (Old Yellow Enzyme family)/thioredoxin reductase|nr:oxidase [Herbinix sp.]